MKSVDVAFDRAVRWAWDRALVALAGFAVAWVVIKAFGLEG